MNDFSNSIYTFGESPTFMTWTPNTEITLCRVPWGADYRDVVQFPANNGIDNYIDNQSGLTIKYDRTMLVTPSTPIKVDVPLSVVYQYNYLRVRNYAQNVEAPAAGPFAGTITDIPRSFYYFINDAVYHAPNTTQLLVQLDVWQTFSKYVTFGNCYVERGHIGIANEKAFTNQGRDYLTVPEGLDVGDEYWIKSVAQHFLASIKEQSYSPPFNVLVASSVDFATSGGTIDAPVLNSAIGSSAEGLPNGLSLYLFPTVRDWTSWLLNHYTEPWVTSGVVSATVIPGGILTPSGPPFASSSYTMYQLGGEFIETQEITLKQSWRNDILPTGRYSGLKKFLTFPYCLVELTTNSGTPLVLKPESCQDDDLIVVQLAHMVPPDPRIGYYIRDYNKNNVNVLRNNNGELINDYGEFLDMVTGIFNFPQFSVVNDGYLNYMASNRNGIAYQYSSADWSQQRALTGNQLAFGQANIAMNTAEAMTGITNQAARQSNTLNNETLAYRSIQQGVNGAVGGLAQGGGAGAVGAAMGAANAAAGYAIGQHQNNASTAIVTGANSARTQAAVGQMGYNRDTNKAYADYAAKGDYANEIRAINAKVRDARMIQPTTAGQLGGDAFNLATTGWMLLAKFKTIDNATMRMIGDFWLRYGYAINAFAKMPPNYMVMEKFTYWKLKESYVNSAYCPEMFKATLRGIFEKGVTVWADPSYIGNIDIADNAPLAGVSY